MTNERTLWVVSGGSEAIPGIKRAKAMGLHIVISDMNHSAPAFPVADDTIVCDSYDAERTAELALNYSRLKRPIDGVICIAADVPVTVATVAAALGLPGIPIASARLAADKLAMKEAFVKAGVPTSWFQAIGSVDELRRIVRERGFPLVLKPVDARGARGVLRLTDKVDLDWAYKHAVGESRHGGVMIEEYLAGPQISTEGLLLDGVGMTCGFIDRNYEHLERFAPFIIENGGQQPSVLPAPAQQQISDVAMDAGRAIGIVSGSVKGDMVWTDRGPYVIEVAARLSGGWMSTDQIPLGTGVDLIGAAIRLALGEPVTVDDIRPRWQHGVAIRYLFPPPGRVEAIEGVLPFVDVPWVHRMGFFVEKGEILYPIADHAKRAGLVITTGDTREEAVARAEHVIGRIRMTTVQV